MSDTKSKSDSQRAALFLLHSPKAKDILFWGMIISKVLNKTPQIYRFDDFILLTNEKIP